MNTKITTLQARLGQLQGDAHAGAESALTEMRARRDAFQETLKKEGESAQSTLATAKASLESHLSAFNASAKKALPHGDDGAK
jgi:hypothetical protein